MNFLAAFGLIGAIIAAASLHLHVSYKYGVLDNSGFWTKQRIRKSTYFGLFILIGCTIGNLKYNIHALISSITSFSLEKCSSSIHTSIYFFSGNHLFCGCYCKEYTHQTLWRQFDSRRYSGISLSKIMCSVSLFWTQIWKATRRWGRPDNFRRTKWRYKYCGHRQWSFLRYGFVVA